MKQGIGHLVAVWLLLFLGRPSGAATVPPYDVVLGWDADSQSAVDAAWEPHLNPFDGSQAWTWSEASKPQLVPVDDPSRQGLNAAFVSDNKDAGRLVSGSIEAIPLDLTNGATTFEAWIRPDSLSGGRQLLYSFGGRWAGVSLTLDDATLRLQVRQSDVRGRLDSPPEDGVFDDGREDLVAVIETQLSDVTRFVHVVATIEPGGDYPYVALYLNGAIAPALSNSGTGLFKDESVTGIGENFLPVPGTTGQNPLTTLVATDPPNVADIAITDWAANPNGSLLRGTSAGGNAGPAGGPLDLGGFLFRSFKGEIAVFNLYSRALNERQAAILYDQMVQDRRFESALGKLDGLVLSYDAAIGALSGGMDWENDNPVDLAPHLPSHAPDWKLAVTDGSNLITEAVSTYPGIRAAYVFTAESAADDGILWASRTNGRISDTLSEVLRSPIADGSASIELWFRPTDHLGKEVLFETGGAGDGSSLRLDGSSLELAVRNGRNTDSGLAKGLVRAWLGDAASADFVQAVGVIDLEQGRLRLYVDGVLQDETPFQGSHWDGGYGAALGAISGDMGGAQGNGFGGFDGEIAILRLYSRALSDAEVAESFSAVAGGPWPTVLPNIVVMVADDMGIGDTSAYLDTALAPTAAPLTKTVLTPNLERLAVQGIRFTDVHTGAATCAPSRYTLLTGRGSWRTGRNGNPSGSDPMLTTGRSTLGTLLQQVGYRTAAFGKWHLGLVLIDTDGNPLPGFPFRESEADWGHVRVGATGDGGYVESIFDGPLAHGFDYFFGVESNVGIKSFIQNNHFVGVPTWSGAPPQAGQDTSSLGVADWDQQRIGEHYIDQVLTFIDSHVAAGSSEPFFLYYAPNANHSINTVDTWDPAPQITVQGQSFSIRDQAIYTDGSDGGPREDLVYENDVALGLLLDKLEAVTDPRTGRPLRESTLIVFTSDNGADAYDPDSVANAGLRDQKQSLYDGGHRVPFVVSWPDGGVPQDETCSTSFGLVDLYASFAALVGHTLAPDEAEDSANLLPAILGQLPCSEVHRPMSLVVSSRDVVWPFRRSTYDLPDGDLLAIRDQALTMFIDDQLLNRAKLSGPDRGRAVPIRLFDLVDDLHQDIDLLGLTAQEEATELAERLLRYHNQGFSRQLGLGAGQILHTDGAIRRRNNWNGAIGYELGVGERPILVLSLGMWDDAAEDLGIWSPDGPTAGTPDGLARTHTIRLFDAATRQPIASVVVSNDNSYLQGEFRYVDLEVPVRLDAGARYALSMDTQWKDGDQFHHFAALSGESPAPSGLVDDFEARVTANASEYPGDYPQGNDGAANRHPDMFRHRMYVGPNARIVPADAFSDPVDGTTNP